MANADVVSRWRNIDLKLRIYGLQTRLRVITVMDTVTSETDRVKAGSNREKLTEFPLVEVPRTELVDR